MARGAELVVGPALEAVTNVDNHLRSTLKGNGEVVSLNMLVFYLQATHGVLEEQCNRAKVCMLGYSLCTFVQDGSLAPGVVIQAYF